MPEESVSQMDLLNYEVSWGGETLGLVKDVDPSALKLKTKDLMVGKIGDVALGKIVIGLDGTIKTTLHQVKIETIRQLCPWFDSGSVPLTPQVRHQDLYDLADQLVLHPVGVEGTDDDITLLKAYPMFGAPKGDGREFREIPVEWVIFPDRAQALEDGVLVYGFYGPAEVTP